MSEPAASNETITALNRSGDGIILLAGALIAATGLLVALAGLGVSLEWFFTAAVLVVAIMPGTTCMLVRRSSCLAAPAVICLSLASVLSYGAFEHEVNWSEWGQSCLVLLSLCMALAGLARLILWISDIPLLASGCVSLLGLIWLAAPIWLGTHAPLIVHVHPLMTLNRVLINFGLWTERPIAYRYLFSLGQDVPYTLPERIWTTVLLHLAIGAGCGGLSLPARKVPGS